MAAASVVGYDVMFPLQITLCDTVTISPAPFRSSATALVSPFAPLTVTGPLGAVFNAIVYASAAVVPPPSRAAVYTPLVPGSVFTTNVLSETHSVMASPDPSHQILMTTPPLVIMVTVRVMFTVLVYAHPSLVGAFLSV